MQALATGLFIAVLAGGVVHAEEGPRPSAVVAGLRVSLEVRPDGWRVGDQVVVGVRLRNTGDAALLVPVLRLRVVLLLTSGRIHGRKSTAMSPPWMTSVRPLKPRQDHLIKVHLPARASGRLFVRACLENRWTQVVDGGVKRKEPTLWHGDVRLHVPVRILPNSDVTLIRVPDLAAFRSGDLPMKKRLAVVNGIMEKDPTERGVMLILDRFRSAREPAEQTVCAAFLASSFCRGYGLRAAEDLVAAAGDKARALGARRLGLEVATIIARGRLLHEERKFVTSWRFDPDRRRRATELIRKIAGDAEDPLSSSARRALPDDKDE